MACLISSVSPPGRPGPGRFLGGQPLVQGLQERCPENRRTAGDSEVSAEHLGYVKPRVPLPDFLQGRFHAATLPDRVGQDKAVQGYPQAKAALACLTLQGWEWIKGARYLGISS